MRSIRPPPDGGDEDLSPEIERSVAANSRKFFILLAVAVVLFLFLNFTEIGDQIQDWPELYERFAEGGFQAGLYFVLLTAVLMAIGVPRLIFYALGGFAFGFWVGLLLALCGSMIGSFITFRAARWGGRKWLKQRFGDRRFFGRIVHTRPTALSVALVRCLPVSNVVINLALAVGRVRNRAFLIGTLIGFLPQGVIAVLIGAGVADDVPWEGALQLLIALALVVAVWVFSLRRRRAGTRPPER